MSIFLWTYEPGTSPISYRVPNQPEGLPAVDHFDTYWGHLDDLNFTHASGLRCDYPEPIPQPGDYLEVNDYLPDPPLAEGYYYVTAATYLGETRYGRQANAGQLSGRDPVMLPGCTNP